MPVSVPAQLSAAIDRLYEVFAHVPRPSTIDYCDHCFSVDDERALLAPVELRQLSIDVLRPYAANVMLTVGDVDDLRYFVPRILEIACTVEFQWPDLEPLAGRLTTADWRHWPADETAAIGDLWRALWETTLAAFPSNLDIETVLCALANAEDDVRPYLNAWTAALHDPPAAAHLHHLLRDSAGWDRAAGSWRLANAFWGDRDRQVTAWLAGPDLRRAVAAAVPVTHTEQASRVLADVDELLASRGTSPSQPI
jgi:hypothetical protein